MNSELLYIDVPDEVDISYVKAGGTLTLFNVDEDRTLSVLVDRVDGRRIYFRNSPTIH